MRGAALRSGGYAAGVALSLLSAPVLVRHLGVDGFGRYTTVIALVSLVAGLTEAGVNAIAVREYSIHADHARDAVMRQLIGVRLAMSTVALVLAGGFALVAGYDAVLVKGTVAVSLGFLFSTLQTLLAVPLQATLRFGWATALELVRQAVTVVLIVALAISGAGLLPFFAVPIGAGLVVVIATVPRVRGLTPLRPAFHVREWGRLLRATLPWAIATALSAAYFRVGVIVMSIIASERETGYYATSFRIMEVLIMLPAVAFGAALPILSRAGAEDPERFDQAGRRMLELTIIGATGLAVCVVLGAPIAVGILAGPQGDPSIPVLRIQVLALLPSALTGAAGVQLLSIRREWAVVGGNVLGLAAAAALTLVLGSVLDAQGAALATLIAELVVTTVVVGALVRERAAIRPALLTLVPLILLGAVSCAVILVPGLPAVVDLAVGALVFVVGLRLVGRFPPEVREALGTRR
jgi:O-antigen/teichoic acid export membrane protein